MANDKIEMEGEVLESLRGARFKVKLTDNGLIVDCTLSGRMRQNYIRIIPGDKVIVQISPYDLTRGIITWRTK